MKPDPTLHARLLLAGASMEFPIITGTTFRPVWGGYYISIECEEIDYLIAQWCPLDDLNDVACWMVSIVWALNEKRAA